MFKKIKPYIYENEIFKIKLKKNDESKLKGDIILFNKSTNKIIKIFPNINIEYFDFIIKQLNNDNTFINTISVEDVKENVRRCKNVCRD